MNEQYAQKINDIAAQVMVFSRDRVMLSLQFLNRAFLKMPLVASEKTETFETDLSRIYYHPVYVVRKTKQDSNYASRAFLHMILHGIFLHPFRYDEKERDVYDLACDIAVESVILDLKLGETKLFTDARLRLFLDELAVKVSPLSADKIYAFLSDHPEETAWVRARASLFTRDRHMQWIPVAEQSANKPPSSASQSSNLQLGVNGCHEAAAAENGEAAEEGLLGRRRADDWKELSERAQTDIQTYSKERDIGIGNFLANVSANIRDRQDYTEFLRRFSTIGEEMHLDDDSFDYIYYTYGLQHYRDMPLIEPLEYRETNRIREFAIAIDTSGSCQGDVVKRFLQKTYSILKTSESFFEQVNVHIIQCDAAVQHDEKVTSDEEFERYMKNVTLSGFGGTDFRPVFTYVDHLIADHEFQNLKGLLYFTDGQGTYPEKMPDYKTAFVFLEEDFHVRRPTVPPWAMQVEVREDEL
ncbi:MAG: VWA-like domain-containing protein [Eubacteriales bacterium]|nr:VWA-like domain-containing protein [Eubacteriales bacterium]